MSTDWHIKCLDCDVIEHFEDANHRVALMRAIIQYRDQIVAIAPLLGHPNDVDLKTYYGSINPEFFIKHAGHRLKPIDEYGRLDGQCIKNAMCRCCKVTRPCVLDEDHPGECASVKPYEGD